MDILYTKYAIFYDEFHKNKNYEQEVRYIRSFFPKSKFNLKILDVGCGTGEHLSVLEKEKNFICYGLDKNKAMIKLAKKKLKQTKLCVSNLNNIKINQKFDVILCLFNTVYFTKTIKNFKQFVKKIYSLLNDGGVFIFDLSLYLERFVGNDAFKFILDSNSNRYLLCEIRSSKLSYNYIVSEYDNNILVKKEKYLFKFFELSKLKKICDNYFSCDFFSDGISRNSFKNLKNSVWCVCYKTFK